MKLTHEAYDQIAVLKPRGELTREVADDFRKYVIDRTADGMRDFVIDAEHLDFVDSTGLETLLWLQDHCGERLGQVRLALASETINCILELTRLASRFDSHADVEGAIKSLR